MKNEKIINALNDITPNELQKDKMLSEINSRTKRKIISRRWYTAIAIAVVLIFCISQQNTIMTIGKQAYYFLGNNGKVDGADIDDYYVLKNEVKLSENSTSKIGYACWHDESVDLLVYCFNETDFEELGNVEISGGEKVGESKSEGADIYKVITLKYKMKSYPKDKLTVLLGGSEMNIELSNANDCVNEVKHTNTVYSDIYVYHLPGDINGYYIFSETKDKYKEYLETSLYASSVEDENGIIDSSEYFQDEGFLIFKNNEIKLKKLSFDKINIVVNDENLNENSKIVLDLPEVGESIDVNKDYEIYGIKFHIGNVENKGSRLYYKITSSPETPVEWLPLYYESKSGCNSECKEDYIILYGTFKKGPVELYMPFSFEGIINATIDM